MKEISASKFRTHCLQLINEVHAKREDILIMKNGKPIAKLSAAGPADIFGFMRGKAVITGDIVSPLPPEDLGKLGMILFS